MQMAHRNNRSGLTARQAAKAIQTTSPSQSANSGSTEFAAENLAEARQQNQMFAHPGKRATEDI